MFLCYSSCGSRSGSCCTLCASLGWDKGATARAHPVGSYISSSQQVAETLILIFVKSGPLFQRFSCSEICPASLMLFASGVNSHSEVGHLNFLRKKKKKNTKQEGGRDICQRRYNMKGGGNIELRTSDLLGSRSSYAKGLWVGCPACGPQWRWTVPSVSTWVTCPSSLRVGVWVWGRHLTWLLMLCFIGFKASSFQVQVSSS